MPWGPARIAGRPPACANIVGVNDDSVVSAVSFPIVNDASVPREEGGAARFAGEVVGQDVLPEVREGGLRGSRFEYAPGARSHWHVHTGEQALVVVEGQGLLQWEGLEEPVVLRAGDWVHVLPGVPHWHGATDDTPFVHLAVTASGDTQWLDPVEPEAARP